MTSSQASENLRCFVRRNAHGEKVLDIPAGQYKGWLPKSLYSFDLAELYIPFMKLFNFPVRGNTIGNLSNLKGFFAVGNYLCTLPKSFAQCTCLRQLNLSFNNLEKLPPSIFKLTNLVELDLSENSLDSLPPEIGNLKKLRKLNICGNILNDIPEEMSQCKNLQCLNISGKWHPRGGLKTLPQPLCKLSELTVLECSWHQIDTLPSEIGNLRKLHTLSLRGNHLKCVSKSISQCINLQELNLTSAMRFIPAIPTALFTLPELRILNFSGNFFTEIPPEICNLKKLQVFLFQRNALLRLPDGLFCLYQLEELELADNYLESIPASIKKLQSLKYLNLTNNKMKVLPEEICHCQSLETLNLAFNQLVEIPEKLYRLSRLSQLNLMNNQLKKLPPLLDRAEGLLKSHALFLHNNYLLRPPQEICDQGVKALFQYLKEIRESEANHRKKMILTGAVKAGKTSLRNALILGQSKLTAEDERTWVLERHLWEPEASLRIQILDFGGHHIYSAAHHLFLTPEALHVLVFDFSVYKSESYDFRIGDWLDAITDRAPGAVILLVGTHADLCSKEEIKEKEADILERMHAEENCKKEDLKNKLAQLNNILESPQARDAGTSGFADTGMERIREKATTLERMLATRVSLPDEIQVVSCAGDLFGIEELQDRLLETLKMSADKPLPKSWYRFLIEIQQKEEKILNWDDALQIFNQIMDEMGESMISQEGSAIESFKVLLKYLHVTGEIVWYHNNPKLDKLVFHRPETLIEMLRAIFRHDFEAVVQYNLQLGNKVNLSSDLFHRAKDLFLQEGLMSIELLKYILCHFGLAVNALDIFASLMLKFDLCYEVPISLSTPALLSFNRLLLFPWFLPDSPPDNLNSLWLEDIPKDTIQLSLQLEFSKKGRPNFFEKITVRLQNIVTSRHDWKDGVFATWNMSKILLLKKRTNKLLQVTFTVRGSDLQEIWSLILTTWQDMLAVLQEWPFVWFESHLICSHCMMSGNPDPFRFPGKVLELHCPRGVYQLVCPKEKNFPIPACFVYSLDPEFQEDLPKHIQAVTDFMARKQLLGKGQDNIDGIPDTGMLSDLGLSYVSAQLGADWFLVGLRLNLPQVEIERIQLDHPSDSFRQILKVLTRWRDREPEKSQEDKIQELLEVLSQNGKNNIVEDLKSKYAISYS